MSGAEFGLKRLPTGSKDHLLRVLACVDRRSSQPAVSGTQNKDSLATQETVALNCHDEILHPSARHHTVISTKAARGCARGA